MVLIVIKKDIESERITGVAVIFNYLANERLGINYDVRKNIYDDVDKLTFEDIKAFSRPDLSGKPYTYCIVGSEKKIDVDGLLRYGKVKKLSLEEIFGYYWLRVMGV